ncbi:MAG TPA: hypothetical protein VGD67_22850 [Pseudonocardiaceae bacterium]
MNAHHQATNTAAWDDDSWADLFARDPGAEYLAGAADGYAAARDEALSPRPGRLPTLPDDFWQTRPALAHIRQAARARIASPDAVLLCALARIASIAPHTADAGIGPFGTPIYAAVVAPSGVGKSKAHTTAADLIELPQWANNPDHYREAGIGSGEGLAELFMGTVTDEDENGKKKPRRAQVRHHALVVVDEGEKLTKLAERSGSTVGSALRAAWTGARLGEAGAAQETQRNIPARTYSLGVVLAYQLETAGPLLADADAGTPQRIVWASARDPHARTGVTWPGPLTIDATWQRHTPITYPDSVTRWVQDDQIARQQDTYTADPLDAHEPLQRLKLAAALALLGGRTTVNEEDWRLAATIWRTSCHVRNAVITHGRNVAAWKQQRADDHKRDQAVRIAADTSDIGADIARVAARLASIVDTHGRISRSDARRKLRHEQRPLFDKALAVAVANHGVHVGETHLSGAHAA